MDGIALQFRKEFPEHAGTNVRIRAVPLQEDVVKHARPALLVLLGAVGLVLVIACANVAHLLLVRATVREGEFALRTALGASRWAVARQLLTESGLLAVAGGGLGLMVTTLALGLLRALHPSNLPRLGEIDVDGRVLAFTAVTCLVTTLTFGLAPALQAARNEPHRTLQAGGRSGTSKARQRVRNLLIMGEVALSVVLLVGRACWCGASSRCSRCGRGSTRPTCSPSSSRCRRAATRRPDESPDLHPRARAAAGRRCPAPAASALSSKLPLTGSGSLSPYAFDEATARNWESVTADGRPVSPDYFAAMNTRLLAGRPFTWDDAIGQAAGHRHRRDAGPAGVARPERRGQAAPDRADGRSRTTWPRSSASWSTQRSHDLTRAVRPQIYFSMGQQTPGRAGRCHRDRRRAGGPRRGGDRRWCTRWTRTWR